MREAEQRLELLDAIENHTRTLKRVDDLRSRLVRQALDLKVPVRAIADAIGCSERTVTNRWGHSGPSTNHRR